MNETKRTLAALTAVVSFLAAAGASAGTVQLDPLLPSSTATAAGASATFLRIDNGWHDSNVYWNETTSSYSATPADGYARIGTLGWGSGLWGINDFNRARSGGIEPVESWSGIVQQVNHGDGCYNSTWSGAWGVANLAPIFDPGTGCADGDADPAQANAEDNWLAWFTGYVRVTDADLYNFSVLYDDGFFFNLYGANDSVSLTRDFLNPRDRLGFDTDLALAPGLYRFELGAYDRLEAGVVDLRWRRGDSTDWWLLPPEYLVDVPEPGAFGLLATGLMMIGVASRRARRLPTRAHDGA